MLQRLYIKNVALIEGLDMEFEDGFNVLTGETGAGKSIIIDAVNLALGERANRELIKSGADKARVEAEFDVSGLAGVQAALEENGLEDEDGSITISRELSASGKNVCRINGALVNLNTLKQITDLLVDVHGQHEHQSLLSQPRHLAFLDAYAHGALGDFRERTAAAYRRMREVRDRLNGGFASEGEREREADILRYQIGEIGRAALSAQEEEALREERGLLMNAERIMTALQLSAEAVAGEAGAFALLGEAKGAMGGIGGLSAEYGEAYRRIEETYYALEDIGYTLRDLRNGFDYDPGRIDAIEQRLETYSTLRKKYGPEISDVLGFMARAEARLEELEGAEELRAKLRHELSALEAEYAAAAEQLSLRRREAARGLEEAIMGQLADLGMEKARFEVRFEGLEEPGPRGLDRVEFLLCANPGEALKPLEKVASGGEISRIMLAFKATAANADSIPTLIFDEIDTGISGRTAGAVGSKMVSISHSHQVLCVTHLPQIAALADAHYVVEKHEEGGVTRTGLKRLGLEERYAYLAAMMGGGQGGSRLAYEHAKELIDASEREKQRSRGNC